MLPMCGMQAKAWHYHQKIQKLAHALILTEDHSTPTWNDCQGVSGQNFFFQKTILNLLRHLAKDSEILDTYVICLEEEVFT